MQAVSGDRPELFPETHAPRYEKGHLIHVGVGFPVNISYPVSGLYPDRAFSKASEDIPVKAGSPNFLLIRPGSAPSLTMDTMPLLGGYLVTSVERTSGFFEHGLDANRDSGYEVTAYQLKPQFALGQRIRFKTKDAFGMMVGAPWPKTTSNLSPEIFGKYQIPAEPIVREMQSGDLIQIVQGMPINVFGPKGVEGRRATHDYLGKYAIMGFDQRVEAPSPRTLGENGRIYTASRLLGGNGHPSLVIFLAYDKRTGLLPIHAEDVEFVKP
jgi:hypothetical protein